ncbi:hypothetical protein J6590_029401, partial [Homalodisca vitripennis]
MPVRGTAAARNGIGGGGEPAHKLFSRLLLPSHMTRRLLRIFGPRTSCTCIVVMIAFGIGKSGILLRIPLGCEYQTADWTLPDLTGSIMITECAKATMRVSVTERDWRRLIPPPHDLCDIIPSTPP